MKIGIYTKLLLVLLILLWSIATANAQAEVLTNSKIAEMTKAGLGKQLILTKINSSAGNYDTSADALIALKKDGVDDEVVAAMMEVVNKTSKQNRNISAETNPLPPVKADANKTAAQLLKEAKTIYFLKQSLYPSLSDLESSLLKRPRWDKFNLTITRNGEEADLIVEINREFLTHYAFRVLDQKTGKVITASGVTSLGGSLAGNIADKIIKRFNEVLANEVK